VTFGGYSFRIRRLPDSRFGQLELVIEPATSKDKAFAGPTVVQVWLGPIFFPFAWIPLVASIFAGLTAASFGDFARRAGLK
jgi:hypothetical protein